MAGRVPDRYANSAECISPSGATWVPERQRRSRWLRTKNCVPLGTKTRPTTSFVPYADRYSPHTWTLRARQSCIARLGILRLLTTFIAVDAEPPCDRRLRPPLRHDPTRRLGPLSDRSPLRFRHADRTQQETDSSSVESQCSASFSL